MVVLSDHEGLASQWIAGLNTAHGVLDGIRASGPGRFLGRRSKKVDGTLFAGVYFGAVVGLSRAHPEIDPAKYGKETSRSVTRACRP